MAINYGYGVNPNMGQFVSSYLQGTGMQARAHAEEEEAKAKAKSQVSNAFTNMVTSLATTYAKKSVADQDAAKASYKDDYIEEKARRTHSRDLYTPGSDSWKEQNQSILDLKKEYKADLLAYKESGIFNRDASLLEFGTEDPKFTGLSNDAQKQISGNDKLIADLKAKKEGIEAKEFKETEFIKTLGKGVEKRERDAVAELGKKREGLKKEQKAFERLATVEGNRRREELLRADTDDLFATPLAGEAQTQLSKQFHKKYDPIKKGIDKSVKRKGDLITQEGNKLGSNFLKERKELSEFKEDTLSGFGQTKKGYAEQIKTLQEKNKGLIKEGEKNLEGYDFDPVTGKALKRSELKFKEQRRYQEKKHKDVLRGQMLGMVLTAGGDLSDLDTSGTAYEMMTEEQIQAVQNNAMDPKLRRGGGDALKFGRLLDSSNKEDVAIAEAFGQKPEEFNEHVKVAYETRIMGRVRNAGGNYEALESIKKEIEQKDPTFLEGTTISPGMIDQTISDSKLANQKTMYTALNQVMSMGNGEQTEHFLKVNASRIQKYEADGVLPKGFAVNSQKLVDTKTKSEGQTLNLKDKQRKLNLLQDYLKQGTTSETGMTPQLRTQINVIASDLGYKTDDLLNDVNLRNKIAKETAEIARQVSLLNFSEKMRKNLYDQEFGSGPQVTGVRVKEGGGVGFQYKKTGSGKIDVQDGLKKFINTYQSRTGLRLTPGDPAVQEHKAFLDHFNMTLGTSAEDSIRKAVLESGDDTVEKATLEFLKSQKQ